MPEKSKKSILSYFSKSESSSPPKLPSIEEFKWEQDTEVLRAAATAYGITLEELMGKIIELHEETLSPEMMSFKRAYWKKKEEDEASKDKANAAARAELDAAIEKSKKVFDKSRKELGLPPE